jgi:hypothetical protein
MLHLKHEFCCLCKPLARAIGVSDGAYLNDLKAVIIDKYPERYHSTLDFTNGSNGEHKKIICTLEEENRKIGEELARARHN